MELKKSEMRYLAEKFWAIPKIVEKEKDRKTQLFETAFLSFYLVLMSCNDWIYKVADLLNGIKVFLCGAPKKYLK